MRRGNLVYGNTDACYDIRRNDLSWVRETSVGGSRPAWSESLLSDSGMCDHTARSHHRPNCGAFLLRRSMVFTATLFESLYRLYAASPQAGCVATRYVATPPR